MNSRIVMKPLKALEFQVAELPLCGLFSGQAEFLAATNIEGSFRGLESKRDVNLWEFDREERSQRSEHVRGFLAVHHPEPAPRVLAAGTRATEIDATAKGFLCNADSFRPDLIDLDMEFVVRPNGAGTADQCLSLSPVNELPDRDHSFAVEQSSTVGDPFLWCHAVYDAICIAHVQEES